MIDSEKDQLLLDALAVCRDLMHGMRYFASKDLQLINDTMVKLERFERTKIPQPGRRRLEED